MPNENSGNAEQEYKQLFDKKEEELRLFTKAFQKFIDEYSDINKLDGNLLITAIYILAKECNEIILDGRSLLIPDELSKDKRAEQLIETVEFCRKTIDAFDELLKNFIPAFKMLSFVGFTLKDLQTKEARKN
jgi:hypothetical protein